MVELNNQITAELDITPGGTQRTWRSLCTAFKSISRSLGENVYTASYLSDGGFSSSEVTGLNFTVTFRGDYIAGDPVIEYIFSKDVLYGVGDARKTKLRLTKKTGVAEGGTGAVIWDVTMTKIQESGGDANEPNSVTLELKGAGRPDITGL
ncbi:MAG: hypothetical protein LBC82_08965 [Oscillospiraceae bacterium]|jgi:hypothetical protein|nr:hypothetical protein [Oscillospiraceae bacterium]